MEELKLKKLILSFSLLLLMSVPSFAGFQLEIPETDTADPGQLVGFFDLRDRESFIQVTNLGSAAANLHIQIFDVSNNCNENNFFDAYTPNDTHVYNLRDVLTNDGNPSGVALPDNAYGVVAITIDGQISFNDPGVLIGNLRIEDDNGYEYRTNLQGLFGDEDSCCPFATFNFNLEGNVTFSDIIGIPIDDDVDGPGLAVDNILDIWWLINVDIYDNIENPFSCRDVVFACTNQESPLYEGLLEEAGASVASFEYGINNLIPHSKGGELLCPGNTITEGLVRFQFFDRGDEDDREAIFFIGLNNGNGRGSIDALWIQNGFFNTMMDTG